MEKPCVDATCHGFGNAVSRQRFSPPQAKLEDTRLILDQQPNGLTAQPPLPG